MSNTHALRSLLLVGACATAMTAVAMPVAAQTKPAAEVSEVVVTGSFIRGTPEDSALPVDVIGAEELAKQGSPSMVELVKATSASVGAIGENSFANDRGQNVEGMGSINLRGLGPERTLVLLNGRRLPSHTALNGTTFVDTNMLPPSAIGRIEILKDGAASTYGSDAIGGVVNFITKRNVRGLEIGGDYRFVSGSDGEVNLTGSYGWVGERANAFLSAGYQHRSEVPVVDGGDFALQPYTKNPQGGWTGGGNPGNFIPVTGSPDVANSMVPVGAQRADPGCAAVGGILTNPGAVPGGFSNCRTQFTPFETLVDTQTRYQIYGEINADLSDTMTLHVETLYGHTDVPHSNLSPSLPTSRPVTRTVLPTGIPDGGATGFNTASEPDSLNFFYAPLSNPGVAAFAAANPTFFAGPTPVTGVFLPVGQFRPFLAGGNPAFGYGESIGIRESREIHVVADVKGELEAGLPILREVSWEVSFDYGRYERRTGGSDTLTGRLALALRGLGGPNCDFRTGAPGVGPCQYLNPFSNAIPANGATGRKNPAFNAATENSAALAAWIFPFQDQTTTQQLAVWEAVINGKTTINLPGGAIGWAAGAQYKRDYYASTYNGFANADIYPCSDTPITGNSACFPSPQSPSVFAGVFRDLDLVSDNYAVFGELSLPIAEALNAQVSARFEDYGHAGGATFNPQVRAKWQINDLFALRGSIGTTFRAPPATFLVANPTTTLQNVLGTFRPVDIGGNPDLKPEKATTYSVGAIAKLGGFRGSIDYWGFDFKGIITSEPLSPVVAALFPSGSGSGNCATLDSGFIAAHFDFAGGCNAANVTKVKTLRINGPRVKTSGIDILGDYTFEDVWGGALSFGGSATYVINYKVAELTIGGVRASAAYDGVGRFNSGQIAYPLPQWKAQLYAEFNMGPHNLRWTTRYTDSYVDERSALFVYSPANQTLPLASCPAGSTTPGCGIALAGQKIKARFLHDLTYRVFGPWSTTFTASVTNVFDTDPPFARTEQNYDPSTGDPLGRTFKLGAVKTF